MGRPTQTRQTLAWLLATLSFLAAHPVAATPAAGRMPASGVLSDLQQSWSLRAAEVGDAVTNGTAQADSCTANRGELSCTCLRTGDAAFKSWSQSGRHEGQWLRSGDDVVHVASVVHTNDGWMLGNVTFWLHDDRQFVILQAAEGRMQAGATVFSDLTWSRTSSAPSEIACEAPPAGDASTFATAREARFEDGHWTVSGYRAGILPIPFAARADRPAPGLLPPTVRVEPGNAEAQVDALVYGPLTVTASGTTAGRIGAGVGLVSHRRDQARRIIVLGTYDESGAGLLGSGELSVGGLSHVRGSLEHPMSPEDWSLRRLEQNAFFRDVRRSRIGASLSGPGHSLQITGNVLSDPALPAGEWDGVVRFGATHQPHALAKWDIDLSHWSTDFQDETTHSTTLTVGWRGTVGHVGRAWITPGADVVGNFGSVTATRGFDASTTLSALGSVDAGFALQGRWDRVRHDIRPRLRVGGEMVGLQQRQPEEGAPPFPYQRPDRWRWGLVMLDQTLIDRGFRLRFPIGLFADALGDEGLVDGLETASPFARVTATLGKTSVTAGGVCAEACESARILTAGSLVPWRPLRVWYVLSNLDPSQTAVMWADEWTAQGHTAVRLVNEPTFETDFSHTAGVRLDLAPTSFGIAGRWASPNDYGITARAAWRPRSLGWGLQLSGGYRPPDGSWLVNAGLALRR